MSCSMLKIKQKPGDPEKRFALDKSPSSDCSVGIGSYAATAAAAIDAAQQGFGIWSRMSPAERGHYALDFHCDLKTLQILEDSVI